MNRVNGILGLYTETPLHPGTGQNVGSIDLPVRREKHTAFPFIPSSSLKGSLRDLDYEDDIEDLLFGSKLGSGTHFAGALSISDARILLFPVRSIRHGFLWVTTPFVLHRLKRDLRLIGLEVPEFYEQSVSDGTIIVSDTLKAKDRLILEDMMLSVKEDERIGELSKKIASLALTGESEKPIVEHLSKKFAIVSLNDFIHLVRFGTEVVARNQLTEKKTSNNLWYVELIPRDAVFYTLVSAEDSRSSKNHDSTKVFEFFKNSVSDKYIQLGGNETLGHGWCLATVSDFDTLQKTFSGQTREG